MYQIKFTLRALNQLKQFKKYEQKQILQNIETSLKEQANISTRTSQAK